MKHHKQKRLSFAPLSFDEAITDVLKIKPEPKPPKVIKAKVGRVGKASSINGNRQPPR